MHIIVVACIVIFAGFFVSSICLLRPAKVYKAPEKKNRVTKMAELVKADAKLDAQLATVKNQRELLKGITVAPAPINRKEKYAAQQKPTNPDLPGAPWLLKLIHVFDKEAFLTKLGKFQKRHWTHLNNVYSVTDEADGWGNSILPIVPNWRMDNDDFVVPSDVRPSQYGTTLGKLLATVWKTGMVDGVSNYLVVSANTLLNNRAFTYLGAEIPLTFYDDLPGEKKHYDVYNGIADFVALDADGQVCIIEQKYTSKTTEMGDQCAFRKNWTYQVLYYQLALKQMAELDYLPRAYILQIRESGAVTLSVVKHDCDVYTRAQTKITIGNTIHWFAEKFSSLSLTVGETATGYSCFGTLQVRPVGGLLSARFSIKPTEFSHNIFAEFNRRAFCDVTTYERITVYVDLDEAPLVWTPSQNRIGERYDTILSEARASLLAYKNPERVAFDILWRKNPHQPADTVKQTREILDWFEAQTDKRLNSLRKAPNYPGEVLQQIKNNPRLIDVGDVFVFPGNPGVVGGGIAQDGTALRGMATEGIAQQPRAREVRGVQIVDVQTTLSSSHGLEP